MADNWLRTAGEWLVTPFKFVLAPWWTDLVEKKAETSAVRRRLLEAITRFRAADCQKLLSMDAHKTEGCVQKVIAQLKNSFAKDDTDPTSHISVLTIEREIELQAVSRPAWITIACLAEVGTFNPQHCIDVEFTDATGTSSRSSHHGFTIQKDFPFTNIIAISEGMTARISQEALAQLKEYCTRNPLPGINYSISETMGPVMGFASKIANPKVLLPGWQPASGNKVLVAATQT